MALVGCGGKVVDPDPLPWRIDHKNPDEDVVRDDRAQDDATRDQGERTGDLAGHDRTSRGDRAPPPPTGDPPPATPPATPPPTPAPSASCLTIVVGPGDVHLATLSFAGGSKRSDDGAVLDLDSAAATSITSLGRLGDSLFACSLGKAIRITTATGAVETSTLACDAITADEDGIWVQSTAREQLERYADWTAITDGTPNKTFAPVLAPRIGVNGGVVVGVLDGPEATISIVRLDIATGARTTSAPLAVRGPVNRGVDLASDGYVYLTYQSTMFARYNPASGGMTAAGVMSGSSEGFRGVDFPDASFDAAFCIFAYFFFPDRAKAFAEMRRVLKPRARAVIATWAPIDRRPAMKLGFDSFAEAVPQMPRPTKGDLQEPEECVRERSAAGFVDVSTHIVKSTMHVDSAEHYFTILERSGAPIAAMKKKLPAPAWAATREAVLEAMRKRLPNGSADLDAEAILTVGTRQP